MSRREQIFEFIMENSEPDGVSLDDIISFLGLRRVKSVREDLKHIIKSLKRKKDKYEILIKPAFCRKCGFSFGRDKFSPSKCPRCKSEWIEPARIKIKIKEK
ncbi:MAG: transcriptional regulator [Candidatus Asgardarchaeia archaeon]